MMYGALGMLILAPIVLIGTIGFWKHHIKPLITSHWVIYRCRHKANLR